MIFLPTALFFPDGIRGPRCVAGFCSISYTGSVVLFCVFVSLVTIRLGSTMVSYPL